MAGLEQVQALYRDYLTEAERVVRGKKFGDGLWGFGRHPADDPCHGRFLEELEAALSDFGSSGPPSDRVRELLSYIYRAPQDHQRIPSIYWLLIAAHKLTLPLIPRLDPADAKALREQYGADYPRRARLPAQNQVFAALGRL